MACPNLSNPQVKVEFNQLVDQFGENRAYYLWNANNGYYLDRTLDGDYSSVYSQALFASDGDTKFAAEQSAAILIALKEAGITAEDLVASKLFGLKSTDLIFDLDALDAVTSMAEAMGVGIREVDFDRDDVLAAANFIEKTIDITKNAEDRVDAWNKLPEEVSHWWYRLLSNDTDLKKQLWKDAQKSKKFKELKKKNYGNYALSAYPFLTDEAQVNEFNNRALIEEAIGQIIAEEINRKTRKKSQLSFFEKFKQKVRDICDKYIGLKHSSFEQAAQRILNTDVSDLLDITQYPGSYVNTNDDSSVFLPEHIKFMSKIVQEILDISNLIKANLPNYIERQKNILRNRLLGKRVRFVPLEDNDIDPTEDDMVETPIGINSLDKFIKKYEKNPIPLNQQITFPGAKKSELNIYNYVLNLARQDQNLRNKKSIKIDQFLPILDYVLRSEYLLTFAKEHRWEHYRIEDTFTNTDGVHHNKIGIWFNRLKVSRRTHFYNNPFGFGSYTYFHSEQNDPSAVIHEIQSDVIEDIDQFFVERNQQQTDYTTILNSSSIADQGFGDKYIYYLIFKDIFDQETPQDIEQFSSNDIRRILKNKLKAVRNSMINQRLNSTTINQNRKDLEKLKFKLQHKNYLAEAYKQIDQQIEDLSKEGVNIRKEYYEQLEFALESDLNSVPNLTYGSFFGNIRLVDRNGNLKKEPSFEKARSIWAFRLSKGNKANDNSKIVGISSNITNYYRCLSRIDKYEKLLSLTNAELEFLYNWISRIETQSSDISVTVSEGELQLQKAPKEVVRNFFNPLVHHLIQSIIKQTGKNTKIYFPGYRWTMLLQGAKKTAAIYATDVDVRNGVADKVGPMYTALRDLKGIKLEWVDNIPGLVDPTVGGYRIDVSNYNYDTPMLYGLKNENAAEQQELDDISYENELDSNMDSFVANKLHDELIKNPNANKERIIIEAKQQWLDNETAALLGNTKQFLMNSYGLERSVGENGNVIYKSRDNDERSSLIIQFLRYLDDGAEGYYEHNSKSHAAHHVIAVALDNMNPETFDHELAHHYIAMFWNSKLIQTALKALDKLGYHDEVEREEELVRLITSFTANSRFSNAIESDSWYQKFWGKFAYMLYSSFNIQNSIIRNGLMQNVARSFMLNERQKSLQQTKNLYNIAEGRKYSKKNNIKTYRDRITEAQAQEKQNKSIIPYAAVQQDRTQQAVYRIIQGVISRNKSYRRGSDISPKILVQMQVSEDEVREFAKSIKEYRKNYIDGLGKTEKELSRKEKKESTKTPEEIKRTIKLLQSFLQSAQEELLDLYNKLLSAQSEQYAAYFYKTMVYPSSGEEVIEYVDQSQRNDSGVETGILGFDELQNIRQNTVMFYVNTISDIVKAVRNPDFKVEYGENAQNKLLSLLLDPNIAGLYSGNTSIMQILDSVTALYEEAALKHLRYFINNYINEEGENLSQDQKERLKYSIWTWLEDQNTFGDIGVTETWLGLASNSKSPLIRMLQDVIDNMSNEKYDATKQVGDSLRQKRIAALKSIGRKTYSIFNFDKMFMEVDSDGFTGNFSTHVNKGRFLRARDKYITTILYGKDGIQDQIRIRLNDKNYDLEIDFRGNPMIPLEMDDLYKDYKRKLNHWLGEHCVRRYTVDYYDKQIEMLSAKSARALQDIDDDIGVIIKACTINGKIHTELLTNTKMRKLKQLYNKKQQLANPYNTDGSLKPIGSDERQIADELSAWNDFKSDKIKYKLDEDAFNTALEASIGNFTGAEADAKRAMFYKLNTYRQINPKLWDYLSTKMGTNSSDRLQQLRNERRKLMSTIQQRGYTLPDMSIIFDDSTGDIRAGYEDFWKNLKRLDEEIYKEQKKIGKLGQNKRSIYSYYMTEVTFKGTFNGVKESWFKHIENATKERVKRQNPGAVNIDAIVEQEMRKYYANKYDSSGQITEKVQLSIFELTTPTKSEFNINGETIKSLTDEPIQIYSSIDVENSNQDYIDDRFDETEPTSMQPFNDKTKGGVPMGKADYTNYSFIRNVENGTAEVKEYYNALWDTMKTSYESVPFAGKYDGRLPQKQMGPIQYFFNKSYRPSKVIKYWYNRNVWSLNESDIDVNSDYELRPDGSRSMNIPIRYIDRISDPTYISTDLLGTVTTFYEMAKNFEIKQSKLPMVNTFLSKLNQNKSNNELQRAMLSGMINRQFYDRLSTFDTDDVKINVYTNYMARHMMKFVPFLKGITQTGLLALNIFAGSISYLDPAIQLDVDALVGKYIDISDWLFGHMYIVVDGLPALFGAGKSRAYGLIPSAVRHFGMNGKSAVSMYANTNTNQIGRLLQSGVTMWPFRLGEYTINARTVATVMHSYRYYNGKFYNRRQFIQHMSQTGEMTTREAKKMFNSWEMQSNTLLNAYESKNGDLIVKQEYKDAITPEFEKEVRKRMKNRATNYNYIVPEGEKTKIQSQILASFIVVMRTFMLVGFLERFKTAHDFQIEDETIYPENEQREQAKILYQKFYKDKGGYNFQTKEVENGTFMGVFSVIRHMGRYAKYLWWCAQNKSFAHSRYEDEYVDKKEELNIADVDIYGINRFLTELIVIGILSLGSVLWHNKIVDDDDDSFAAAAIDYILLKLAIERMTFMNPDTLLEIITSVTASKSDIDRKFKLWNLIQDLYIGITEHGELRRDDVFPYYHPSLHLEDWDRIKGQSAYKGDLKVFYDIMHVLSSTGAHGLYTSSSKQALDVKTKFYKKLAPWTRLWHKKQSKSTGKNKSTKKSKSRTNGSREVW